MITSTAAAEVAKRYVERCNKPVPTGLWTFLENDLHIGDDFGVTLRRRLSLDSAKLGDLGPLVDDTEIISCPYLPGGVVSDVTVTALGSQRSIQPVATSSIQMLSQAKPPAMAAVKTVLAIPMEEREYRFAPEISIASTAPGTTLAGTLSWSGFLPVSEVTPGFDDPDLPDRLRVRLPVYANASVVALQMKLLWKERPAGLSLDPPGW